MSSLVTLDHIHKQHRLGGQSVHALSDVCLEIDRAEFVAVVGPSGSGKSTLLSILGCLDQPSCGRYLLHGENVFAQSKSRLSELRNRRIGIVFQNFNLLPRLTALENVALPLFYRREPMRNPVARARAVLEEAIASGDPDAIAVAKFLVHETEKPRRTPLRKLPGIIFRRMCGE